MQLATLGHSKQLSRASVEARLGNFARLLSERFGLRFSAQRKAMLADAVIAGMSERELDSVAEYLQVVASDDRARERLAALSTTGETYFFRHPEQLAVVHDFVVPEIIRRRGDDGDRVVRAWSAGCATGEEAYSLAILLANSLTGTGDWAARVAGSDLNAEAVAHARSAAYGRWSFRDMDSRWNGSFSPGRGKRVVDQRIASLVTFSVHNLAAHDASAPPALGGPADLVVCRNVLMYLDAEAAERVLDLLYRALRPGGWLLTGPTEMAPEALRRFERQTVDGVTFYRRPLAPERPQRTGPAAGRAAMAVDVGPFSPALPRAERLRRDRPPARPRPARREQGSGQTAASFERPIDRARRLADAGLLDEAREICAALLVENAQDIEVQRLIADTAEAAGDLPAARAALEVLLAHSPEDTLVEFRLALIDRRLGDHRASEQRFAAICRRVEQPGRDEELDEAGEITAVRLGSVARMMLRERHDA